MRFDLQPPRVGKAKRLTNPRAIRPLACIVVGLVGVMALTAVTGFALTSTRQAKLHEAMLVNRQLRNLEIALINAETGVRGYVITGKIEYLEPYRAGLEALDELSPGLLPEVDAYAGPDAGARDGSTATRTLVTLRQAWQAAVTQAEARALPEAQASLEAMHTKALMDAMRRRIGGLLAQRDHENDHVWARIGVEQDWVLLLNLMGAATAIGALIYAFDQAIRDAARRLRAVEEQTLAARQIELLLVMAEMLQSATDRDDANEVLRSSAAQLMPGLDGALYVFNASRDRLDLSTCWTAEDGPPVTAPWPDHIGPASCWALKRGKPHRNEAAHGALRCAHLQDARPALEIPMVARGEIYGLLELSAAGAEAGQRLEQARPMAAALADSMSLALSSISMREKLRNQALRDPLTGLYNRRFLEEMLERLAADTGRRKVGLSAVMLDLDHFKSLNDQFGHATGDAVLRQAANVILATIRTTDVACRFGGEEIALLMPDCDLDVALAKAEQVREAIAGMSRDGKLPSVTASLGVACVPETTGRAEELLGAADAALYGAKQQGRNRVVAAPLRTHGPVLVASA